MIQAVKAYANCDRVLLMWQAAQRIEGLRGFAIYRKRNGGAAEPLETTVGFAQDQGAAMVKGPQPSTVWPVQGFNWADFDVQPGDTLQYQVVPMLGSAGALAAAATLASDWTEPVTVTAACSPGIETYFNRGVVASQYVSRILDKQAAADGKSAAVELATDIATAGGTLRVGLTGRLLPALLGLLAGAAQAGVDVYLSVFELNDPELIAALKNLGMKCHLILANGAAKPGDGNPPDENTTARAALRGVVDLHDRMVNTGEHLSHHKFAVICDAAGQPAKVWTGSTNWTSTGLCTQANNAILIEDPQVAAQFKAQWDLLLSAGNGYPPDLLAAGAQKKPAVTGDGRTIQAWFAPMKGGQDLADAGQYIRNAKQGILFMMFDPGPSGTLLDDIIAMRDDPANAHLYIRGVLNQDPSTCSTPVHLFPGHGQQTDHDYQVVLPAAVNEQVGFFVKEVLREPAARVMVMVHSKVVVVDPLGPNPVVMTGSHNMGPKASGSNDDNLIIVQGDRALAIAYALNIEGVYRQYHWNNVQNQQTRPSPQPSPAAPQAGEGGGVHSAQPAPTGGAAVMAAVTPAGDVAVAAAPGPSGPGEAPGLTMPAQAVPALAAAVVAVGGAAPVPGSSLLPPLAPSGSEGCPPAAEGVAVWSGLQDDDCWQNRYFSGEKLDELNFWLGNG